MTIFQDFDNLNLTAAAWDPRKGVPRPLSGIKIYVATHAAVVNGRSYAPGDKIMQTRQGWQPLEATAIQSGVYRGAWAAETAFKVSDIAVTSADGIRSYWMSTLSADNLNNPPADNQDKWRLIFEVEETSPASMQAAAELMTEEEKDTFTETLGVVSTSAASLLAAASAMDAEQAAAFAAETPPIITLTPATALVLTPPAGTYPAGARVKYHITPSVEVELTTSNIVIPSDSTFAGKTLAAGELYLVQLEYSGSFWMLTTLVGGYATPN